MADRGKSSTGLNANLAGLLVYTLGVISGVIFFLIEKDSKFVKFHAMQAIVFSVTMFLINTVLAFLPVVGGLAARTARVPHGCGLGRPNSPYTPIGSQRLRAFAG